VHLKSKQNVFALFSLFWIVSQFKHHFIGI
jgi:hypothetical protein